MDISQIRTLCHVAEIGSLSGAAQRLGIAQPALSRQIRLLEQELGAPVFERHGRGMTPTELGRQLLEPAGKILGHIDEMRRLATQEATSFVGRVRVGVTPTVAEVATLPLVERIRHAHPLLSLSFTSGFSGHLVEWLKRDELDVCVSYDTQTGGLVRTRPVVDETLILVGSAARNLDMMQPVSFAELAGEPLVLPSPAHGLRTILDECARRAGIVLSPSLEADSLQAMIDLVGGGVRAYRPATCSSPYTPRTGRTFSRTSYRSGTHPARDGGLSCGPPGYAADTLCREGIRGGCARTGGK
jgi:LysR family transcriptional regulator, nitrogen assimilation regulatory protein